MHATVGQPRRPWLRVNRWVFVRLGVLVGTLLLVPHCLMIRMPGSSYVGARPTADPETVRRLTADVRRLAEEIGERNLDRPEQLAEAEGAITLAFEAAGYRVIREPYRVGEREVANLSVTVAGSVPNAPILLIGAHYDSDIDCPAANDNGTGVAALLELARRFRTRTPPITVRFVAFVNEEPPYFQTDAMGSRVCARNCRARGEEILGMISLETMGYYSDEEGSQKYPPPLSLVYPSRGNFIAFVGNVSSRGWVRRLIGLYREHAQFPSEGAALPESLPGVGWSDHWSFWQEGYPALMVTDTAPFRYPHYHQRTDTVDKVDFERLATVVDGLDRALVALSEESRDRD
ncbi:MAG: M28 family peptidase [Planctomycetota bacterium]